MCEWAQCGTGEKKAFTQLWAGTAAFDGLWLTSWGGGHGLAVNFRLKQTLDMLCQGSNMKLPLHIHWGQTTSCKHLSFNSNCFHTEIMTLNQVRGHITWTSDNSYSNTMGLPIDSNIDYSRMESELCWLEVQMLGQGLCDSRHIFFGFSLSTCKIRWVTLLMSNISGMLGSRHCFRNCKAYRTYLIFINLWNLLMYRAV